MRRVLLISGHNSRSSSLMVASHKSSVRTLQPSPWLCPPLPSMRNMWVVWKHLCLALFPGPAQLSIAFSTEKQERAGIFPHVSDIRKERKIERVYLCVGALGPEQRKEPRYQITYYMYLVSGRRLSYTPSIECVGWVYLLAILLSAFYKCGNQNLVSFFSYSHIWILKSMKAFLHEGGNWARDYPLFNTASNKKLGGAWKQG